MLNYGSKVVITSDLDFLNGLTGVITGMDDGYHVVKLSRPVLDPRFGAKQRSYCFQRTQLRVLA